MAEPITTLGQILDTDARRDAIHIAIAPVVALEALKPGQRIGVKDGQATSAVKDHETIGVVDPYLRRTVETGQRFWLFLYPNSITTLRHEWVHPAFSHQEPMDELQVAAEMVAQQCGKTYAALMDDAREFVSSLEYSSWPDYIMDNSERYKAVESEAWEKFWQHFERVTGKKSKERWAPYTCSC
jgi:hypothetical protein